MLIEGWTYTYLQMIYLIENFVHFLWNTSKSQKILTDFHAFELVYFGLSLHINKNRKSGDFDFTITTFSIVSFLGFEDKFMNFLIFLDAFTSRKNRISNKVVK